MHLLYYRFYIIYYNSTPTGINDGRPSFHVASAVHKSHAPDSMLHSSSWSVRVNPNAACRRLIVVAASDINGTSLCFRSTIELLDVWEGIT